MIKKALLGLAVAAMFAIGGLGLTNTAEAGCYRGGGYGGGYGAGYGYSTGFRGGYGGYGGGYGYAPRSTSFYRGAGYGYGHPHSSFYAPRRGASLFIGF